MNHLSRLSICEFTTPALTFEDDLQLYRSVGAAGIAICEQKLNAEIESAQLAAFRDSGLKASVCIPVNIGVLPCDPIFPGPEDPEERIKAMCESIRRLARFEPDRIVVVTGSPRGEDRAREIVIEGLRVAAATAAAEGVRLSLEPLRTDGGLDLTIVSTIPETLALLAETGASNIDIAYDVYHLWDTPNVEPLTRKHARRVGGVHICDWREPPRGIADRLVPGDGPIPLSELLGALEDGGYTGWYDIEIFSDLSLPDSLWKWPARKLVEHSRDGFVAAFERITQPSDIAKERRGRGTHTN